MTNKTLALSVFYKGWDVYQQHLVKVIAPLSANQLALQIAPHLRSIYTIAVHIIGARARWLQHHVLKEEDEGLTDLMVWDRPGQPTRPASELVRGLECTWQVLQQALERWTPEDLDEVLQDVDDDGTVETFTRQWVIWHLIEHDLHHGGELSFALGAHGIVAIDL